MNCPDKTYCFGELRLFQSYKVSAVDGGVVGVGCCTDNYAVVAVVGVVAAGGGAVVAVDSVGAADVAVHTHQHPHPHPHRFQKSRNLELNSSTHRKRSYCLRWIGRLHFRIWWC